MRVRAWSFMTACSRISGAEVSGPVVIFVMMLEMMVVMIVMKCLMMVQL